MFDTHSFDEPIDPRAYGLAANDPERFPDEDQPSEANDEFDDDADEDDDDEDETDDEDLADE